MATQRVAVIDYGMGNLHSVESALQHAGPCDVVVTDDPAIVAAADRVVFPGVGAIGDCMAEIKRLGFDRLISEVVTSGKPLLGICVGMQAMMEGSEESGGTQCLGLFEGVVQRFPGGVDEQGHTLKIPHMGWNTVQQSMSHPLWHGIEDNTRFYFVHSYCVTPTRSEVQAGVCEYGLPFAAAIARDNIFATQFHPEKSHVAGLQLLTNFLNWNGSC
jgi:glutamine amidotransferase